METTKLFFPVWMMFIDPVSWAAIIPGTFLIALIGLTASLYIAHKCGPSGQIRTTGERFFAAWTDAKKGMWRAWLNLCLAYAAGTALMLVPSIISVGLPEGHFLSGMSTALLENTYTNPLAVVWACVSVTLTALLSYLLSRLWTFKKTGVSGEGRVRVAMWIAVFTAPYLFLSTYRLYY